MLLKISIGLMMLALLIGCAAVPVATPALCAGTEALRPAHAGALVDDGGPKSRRTGAALIAAVDAGCQP